MNATSLRLSPGFGRFFSVPRLGRTLVSPVTKPGQLRCIAGAAAASDKGSMQAQKNTDKSISAGAAAKTALKEAKKTMAQIDEELREILEGRSGEGGAAGIEFENGQAVALKRGVKDNMFRVI